MAEKWTDTNREEKTETQVTPEVTAVPEPVPTPVQQAEVPNPEQMEELEPVFVPAVTEKEEEPGDKEPDVAETVTEEDKSEAKTDETVSEKEDETDKGTDEKNEEPVDDGYCENGTLKLIPSVENEKDVSALFDGDRETISRFKAGESIKLSSVEEIRGIYIIWDPAKKPGEWKLVTDKEKIGCGKDGFLHEYTEILPGTHECEIRLLNDAGICEIYGIGEKETTVEIQKWEKTLDKADILVFVPHAGDELIDFGALLASYSSEYDIQVAYMCEYETTDEKSREHDKLDALWKLGITHYPINGEFRNKLLRSYSLANAFYGKDKVIEFATTCIRRFKPQVVVGPDIDGEYGNSTHVLLADAIVSAVDNSGDSEFFSGSAEMYSTWTTKKSYFHWLISTEDGTMIFDPEKEMFGETLLTFLQKVQSGLQSSAWCGSYIEGAVHSLEDPYMFGLYRSVGVASVANDMMADIVSYKEQERTRRETEERDRARYEAELRQIAECGILLFGRFISVREIPTSIGGE